MLKTISIQADDFKQQAPAAPKDTANNVFKVFHGFYGNLFLSKFVNGQTDADGVDQGVVSARAIWSHGLRDIDLDTIKAALAATMDSHPEFPPTLPQFVALCRAWAPRPVYRDCLQAPKPAVDNEERLQEIRKRFASMKAALAVKEEPSGLDLLKQAIADAVRCAGGDEGAALARLDRMFQIKQGATA